MIHGPVDEMSSTGNSLSVSVSSDTCSGLTSVSARSIGRLRLQVLPRILHGLEIGRDLHQRDADTAQLADVDELLDGLHQFLRTFLPVSHYRFVTRCVLLCQSVVEKAVHGKKVGCFNRVRVSLSGCMTDHHTDGIGLVRGTFSEKIQDGLCLGPDGGACRLLAGFPV